jgi:hypothetical protein
MKDKFWPRTNDPKYIKKTERAVLPAEDSWKAVKG